ncbi:MAG TPA: thiamine phosphate synthase [Terriglobales bacterium]|nr:thiamine phosphate synthase [Terriglobales bacterium]
MTKLPRLYAIIDAERLSPGMTVAAFATELIAGGARLLQYRNKTQSGKTLLADAAMLKAAAEGHPEVRLIMNDRADLCIAAHFNGVHLGQDDLSPAGARVLCKPPMLVGLSTHKVAQVRAGDQEPVDYIAIGPVFATGSKMNPDPVVGLEGVRAARKLTGKPLVAIGGITRENCRSVMEAGADSVAVISGLLADPRKTTEEFIRVLG